jgi:hypothetical protein
MGMLRPWVPVVLGRVYERDLGSRAEESRMIAEGSSRTSQSPCVFGRRRSLYW